MEPSHLVSYASRDRAAVAALRARHYSERTRRLGAWAGIEMADALRRHVRALRPDWPPAADRDADLESHIRLGELLRRARPARSG